MSFRFIFASFTFLIIGVTFLFPNFRLAYEKSIGSTGSSPAQFFNPSDMCLDEDNRIYVLDRQNRRIEIFDSEGRYMTLIKRDYLINASGIIAFGGDIYTIDSVDERVKKLYGLSFEKDKVMGSNEVVLGNKEYHLYLFGTDRYLIDSDDCYLYQMDFQWFLRESFGGYGSGPSLFDKPVAMFKEKEYLYILESKNKRLQVFKDSVSKEIFDLKGYPRSMVGIPKTPEGLVALVLFESYFKMLSLDDEIKYISLDTDNFKGTGLVVTYQPSNRKVLVLDPSQNKIHFYKLLY